MNVSNVKPFSKSFFRHFWLFYAFMVRITSCNCVIKDFPGIKNLYGLNEPNSLINLSGLNDLDSLMVGSSLASKWPISVPVCGMDHQNSNFSLIDLTLARFDRERFALEHNLSMILTLRLALGVFCYFVTYFCDVSTSLISLL